MIYRYEMERQAAMMPTAGKTIIPFWALSGSACDTANCFGILNLEGHPASKILYKA